MGEKLRKGLVGSGLVVLGAFSVKNFVDAHSHASPTATKGANYAAAPLQDPNILGACDQSDPNLQQECDARQALKAIKQGDDVMEGIWAYHVQRSDLSERVDAAELHQAVLAEQAGDVGDCALWSIRVESPTLQPQLPVCG